MNKMSILCKLGIHKYAKDKKYIQSSSNVVDHSKYCLRCGKVKKWVTPRDAPRYD